MPEATGPTAQTPSGHLRRALARADAGKALSIDEIEALLTARGDDLARLMGTAAHGCETSVTATSSPIRRKVFIPLTMLCRDHCHYCTFAKPPAKLDAPYLTPDEAVAIAEAGRAMGCKEALFTLGDRPEDRYDEARAVAGRPWLRLDARLRACGRDPGDRSHRPAPAPQPRRDVVRGDRPRASTSARRWA